MASVFRGMFATAKGSFENKLLSWTRSLELKRKNLKVVKKENAFGVRNILICCLPSWSVIYMMGMHQQCSRPLPVENSDPDPDERNYLLGIGLTPRLIARHYPEAALASEIELYNHDLELSEEQRQAYNVDYRNYYLGIGFRPEEIDRMLARPL